MTDTGSVNGLGAMSTDELRAAVRDVLRDVLPSAVLRGADPVAAHEEPRVVLRSDADLDVFVRRVAALCADPARRADLLAGRHGFRLAGTDSQLLDRGSGAADTVPDGVIRVERGAVTERTVRRAATEGARLVLGRGAVLTPLARDKVRSLGVQVVRERS